MTMEQISVTSRASGVSRNILPRVGVLLLLAGCVFMGGACSTVRENWKQQRINRAALKEAKFIIRHLSPELTKEQLGLERMRAFGWESFPELLNQPKFGDPDYYQGTLRVHLRLPFWCEGIRPDGTVARLRCHANMKFSVLEDNTVRLFSPPALHVDGTLGFVRQFGTWIGVTLISIAIIFIILGANSGFAVIISWILLLPISGYVAFVCFGSAVAVFVCLASLTPIYVWATASMMGADWSRRVPGVTVIILAWMAALTLAGFLLWKVVPYVARGTGDWFRWLFGNF